MGALPQFFVIDGAVTDYVTRSRESFEELRQRSGLSVDAFCTELSERVGTTLVPDHFIRGDIPTSYLFAAVEIAGLPASLRTLDQTRLQIQINQLREAMESAAESQLREGISK